MAALTLATISAVLSTVYADPMANNINRQVVLPNLLAVENDRNSSCLWTAKFTGRSTAGAKAEGFDAVDGDFSTNARAQASLTWAEYFAFAKVSGLSQAIGVQNATPGMSNDPLAEEINDAIDELALVLSGHTYSGSVVASPVQIEGLARAVTATGVYAGVDQGTYSEWAAGVQTLATASLSIANLRTKLHRPFKDNCGMWPEFVTCPGTVFDAVCALFTDQTRIMIDQVTTQARGTVNLKAAGGFRAVEVDGIPYIEDRHCTAATFHALHSSTLSYRQVPPASSQVSPEVLRAAIKQLTGVNLQIDEVAAMLVRGSSRLQPYIEALAKTGDSQKMMVKWYGQLRLKHRNRASKLTLT